MNSFVYFLLDVDLIVGHYVFLYVLDERAY